MAWVAVVGSVLLLAILLRLLKAVYDAHSSVLIQLPSAGWGARYSRILWAFQQEYRGVITLNLPQLHKEVGPLIQIGPREVSFYCIDTYNIVHKVNSEFSKDPRTYGQFVQDGHPALFSITLPEEHSKRRRVMGQVYNRSKMSNLESLMTYHIQDFIKAIRNKKGIFDLVVACRALEADIISDFSFGKSLNAIKTWKEDKILYMVAKNDEKATWMPLITTFPTIHEIWMSFSDVICHAINNQISYKNGLQQFDQWTHEAWRETINVSSRFKNQHPNLIRVLIESGLHPETTLSEAKENLGPGTDTTSGTLAHILYALSFNESYQQRLYEALSEINFSKDMSILERVLILQACVKEGIRWAGAAAAMLPRIVPSGGIEFHGKVIPEGTTLTSSPIWYLRDEIAFPNPKLFDPYRWVDELGQEWKEDTLRDRFYIPFSKGTNICMGIHFSYYELFLSVSQLVQAFHIRPPTQSSLSNHKHYDWHLVSLPERKEWVASVLVENIPVQMIPRNMY